MRRYVLAGWMAVTVLSALAIAGWWSSQLEVTPSLRLFGILGAAVVLFSAGLQLRSIPPFELHWNGQDWALTRKPSASASPVTGALTVAIDLGPWMLLRFRAAKAPRWAGPQWLPIQRRGLESQWHALRCALFSSPSAAADSPAAGSSRLG